MTTSDEIQFTVFARPEPQGSMKGFVLPGKNGGKARAILTSANSKMKPYRQELTLSARQMLDNRGFTEPWAEKHAPVAMTIDFYLARPTSIPKKRIELVVKPDISKLLRSTEDALTGILYADDAQIVDVIMRKHYGSPERVEIKIAKLGI